MFLTGLTTQQELRSQTIMMDRLESRYNRAIAREIARAMDEASKKMGDALWKSEVEAKHAENMTGILTRLWTQSGATSVDRMMKVAKSLPKYERKQDITTPVVTNAISDWIRSFGGEKITQITTTTMTDINQIISKGVEDGLSEREIAKSISAIAPSISAGRSPTIARTEVHGSSQGISLEVAQLSEIEMQKEWIAADNERTREAHAEANGQTVAMTDTFIVDGERLQYPGDPAGSAGNVINCRCVVGYRIT